MAQVTVTIAGRSYRMACDDGQEDHLRGLGQMLDDKIEALRQGFGEIGDMRLLVMASIMVADELSEALRRVAALEQEVLRLTASDTQADAQRIAVESEVSEALESIAGRLERLAADLNASTRINETTGHAPVPRID